MNKQYVTLEGAGLIACEITGYWNGWAMPRFDSENLKIAVNALQDIDKGARVYVHVDCVTVESPEYVEPEEWPLDADGACEFGAGAWVWHEYRADELDALLDGIGNDARQKFDILKREYVHRVGELTDMEYVAELVNEYGYPLYDYAKFADMLGADFDMAVA